MLSYSLLLLYYLKVLHSTIVDHQESGYDLSHHIEWLNMCFAQLCKQIYNNNNI